MGWLEGLRKWIDGEEDIDDKGEPRPRSKWDDFLVAIAREVEPSMQRKRAQPVDQPVDAGLVTVAEVAGDEATIVRPRKPVEPTFSLLLRRNAPTPESSEAAPPDVRPFFKDEISIGRGSSQVAVDL